MLNSTHLENLSVYRVYNLHRLGNSMLSSLQNKQRVYRWFFQKKDIQTADVFKYIGCTNCTPS